MQVSSVSSVCGKFHQKKTQVYRHNVLTTWNRLLSDDDTLAETARGWAEPGIGIDAGTRYTCTWIRHSAGTGMTNTWFSEFWYLGWYLIPEFRYLVPVKLNSDTWHIIPDTWCDHSDTWKPICQVSDIIQVSYQNTCSEPGMLIHRNSIFHFRMHLWVGVPKGPRFDPVFDPVFDTLTPFYPFSNLLGPL